MEAKFLCISSPLKPHKHKPFFSKLHKLQTSLLFLTSFTFSHLLQCQQILIPKTPIATNNSPSFSLFFPNIIPQTTLPNFLPSPNSFFSSQTLNHTPKCLNQVNFTSFKTPSSHSSLSPCSMLPQLKHSLPWSLCPHTSPTTAGSPPLPSPLEPSSLLFL